MKSSPIALRFALFASTVALIICVASNPHEEIKHPFTLNRGALGALEFWYEQRAFPNDALPNDAFFRTYHAFENTLSNERAFAKIHAEEWQPIGPTNGGGRTLALAIDPFNPKIMYAGAASGGLWKSTSGGEGTNAWKYVPTGFPSLSVNAIAINPTNSNEIFIGTGEVYDYQNSIGGHYIRTTRGSYGIGILHSTDGGSTWGKSLDWSLQQQRGIMQIVFNPINPRTVYAATSEGTLRSFDGGVSWQFIQTNTMTNAVVILPQDTSILFTVSGNLAKPGERGIYRSADAGKTFTKLTQGLPSSWDGRTSLLSSPAEPNTLYAGVSNAFESIGIFKTTNRGNNWTALADSDYCSYQGWYSNVLAIHPTNPSVLYAAGVYLWQSNDDGKTLAPINDNYHVDFHCAVFHPTKPDSIYFGTDGGIYKSKVGGSYRALNGGYQTTQFYAGFANAATDSNLAIGGLQDNGTVKFTGTKSWQSIYGGDGCWCAIDPTDANIFHVESQYLNLVVSTNGGKNWLGGKSGINSADPVVFVAPFVLCASNPIVKYSGTDKVYKSTNRGMNWTATNSGKTLSGNPSVTIAVSHHSIDTLYVSTVPTSSVRSGLFLTTNGGSTWQNITRNLPNRFFMDIAIHPTKSSIAYCAVSGFGSEHLFKTTDAGATWIPSGSGLPDVPTQAVLVDPFNPNFIYLGNDLGVFISTDEGTTWNSFSAGLPPCTIADISFSPANRALRIATHGNGVWQRHLYTNPTSTDRQEPPKFIALSVYPNPIQVLTSNLRVEYSLSKKQNVLLALVTMDGKSIQILNEETKSSGHYAENYQLHPLSSGLHFILLKTEERLQVQKILLLR